MISIGYSQSSDCATDADADCCLETHAETAPVSTKLKPMHSPTCLTLLAGLDFQTDQTCDYMQCNAMNL